jgi:hypothetical protein
MIATADMFRARAIPGRPMPPAERRRTEAAALMLVREVVTPVELVQTVNRRLAARSDCQGIEVEAGPMMAVQPDPEGCNWNAGALRVRVAHGASTRALAGVRQVVDWARLHFDLADSDAG